MQIEELLATTPGELATKQYTALVDYVENLLMGITKNLRAGNIDQVEQLLMDSPAGDCMGTDKHFIDFSETGIPTTNGDPGAGIDINDVCRHLKLLKRSIT